MKLAKQIWLTFAKTDEIDVDKLSDEDKAYYNEHNIFLFIEERTKEVQSEFDQMHKELMDDVALKDAIRKTTTK